MIPLHFMRQGRKAALPQGRINISCLQKIMHDRIIIAPFGRGESGNYGEPNGPLFE
jgi:hypothetical protein